MKSPSDKYQVMLAVMHKKTIHNIKANVQIVAQQFSHKYTRNLS